MAVRIGHASIDERSKASGGTAGDQTGKEICIRNWYRGSWKVLLRANNSAVAQKIAQSCMAACANENLGYDQAGRNSGLQAAKEAGWDLGRIEKGAEFDCSSLVTACVEAAGIHIWSGANAPTTRTLEKVLLGTGAFIALKESKYLIGSAYLREGDILLNPGSHVVMVLDDGPMANRSQEAEKPVNNIASAVTYSVVLPLVQRGDTGELIKAIQQLLLLRGCDPGTVDGEFGKNTRTAVEKLQEEAKIEVDGKVGGDTWSVLLGKG